AVARTVTVTVGAGDPESGAVERVDDARRIRGTGGGHRPRRARIEHDVPEGEIGIGAGGPRTRWGSGRLVTVEGTRDHRDRRRATLVVGDDVTGNVIVPEHREVGLDHLVARREVEPDL